MEHEEYTCDNYPCSGKKYNGEKAIISLTSWKARINTVSKTLFSLIKQCPGFHIVLVLSEEEFPKKEAELPENLMLFVENNLIELLWVYKNYKSFKKVLFTMDKYRTVPVISADDDCIYICNYAQELYDAWMKNKCDRIGYESVTRLGITLLCGYSTLFSPNIFSKFTLSSLNTIVNKKLSEDDMLYAVLTRKYKLNTMDLGFKQQHKGKRKVCIFHDTISPLSAKRKYDKNSDLYELEKLV